MGDVVTESRRKRPHTEDDEPSPSQQSKRRRIESAQRIGHAHGQDSFTSLAT